MTDINVSEADRCVIDGCDKPPFARNFCTMHYQRLRTGRSMTLPRYVREAPLIPLSERFWQKVDTRGPDDCWLWTGFTEPGGYGEFQVASRTKAKAHRVSYELVIGPIPVGYEIDHLCRVRNCVNPAHLEAVTPKENRRRSMSLPALNARKTHCLRGHEFTPENTAVNRAGSRCCLSCRRIKNRNLSKARRKS